MRARTTLPPTPPRSQLSRRLPRVPWTVCGAITTVTVGRSSTEASTSIPSRVICQTLARSLRAPLSAWTRTGRTSQQRPSGSTTSTRSCPRPTTRHPVTRPSRRSESAGTGFAIGGALPTPSLPLSPPVQAQLGSRLVGDVEPVVCGALAAVGITASLRQPPKASYLHYDGAVHSAALDMRTTDLDERCGAVIELKRQRHSTTTRCKRLGETTAPPEVTEPTRDSTTYRYVDLRFWHRRRLLCSLSALR